MRLHALIMLLALLGGCATSGGVAGQPTPPPAPPSATLAPPATGAPERATPGPAATQAPLGAPLMLRVGEMASVGPLTLRLTAIENDSRCPTRVSCVWEGAAEAVIAVSVAGGASEVATLTLYGHNRETAEARLQVAGYTIRLTALDPYPADPQPIPQGDYVATFVVADG